MVSNESETRYGAARAERKQTARLTFRLTKQNVECHTVVLNVLRGEDDAVEGAAGGQVQQDLTKRDIPVRMEHVHNEALGADPLFDPLSVRPHRTRLGRHNCLKDKNFY